MMICTIKILINPEEAGLQWNIKKMISKFGAPTKWKKGKKPLFMVDNFLVFGWEDELKIVGSLTKYYNGNNIENLDWRNVPNALKRLSNQLGIPLDNGRISRIDIAVNFEVDQEVTDYFPELFHLDYYDRSHKKATTLKFENNSHLFNYCFYDKKKEVSKKLIADIDYNLLVNVENLMRVELQIQDKITLFLKQKDIRVSDLFLADFCKKLIMKWLKLYLSIQKKAIMTFPVTMKGSRDFDVYRRKCDIISTGWETFDYILDKFFDGERLRSAKSKKRKQYKDAMFDNRNFPLQEHTIELNHKIKLMCCEALKQIYWMN